MFSARLMRYNPILESGISFGKQVIIQTKSSKVSHARFSDNVTLIQKRLLSNIKKDGSSSSKTDNSTFLQRWLGPKEIPPRGTLKWYGEMTLICTVFAITGTSTMFLVRPAMSEVLGLKGSLKEGPWSYRICSIVIMTPLYSTLLVIVGTIFGRHAYFRHFAVKVDALSSFKFINFK